MFVYMIIHPISVDIRKMLELIFRDIRGIPIQSTDTLIARRKEQIIKYKGFAIKQMRRFSGERIGLQPGLR